MQPLENFGNVNFGDVLGDTIIKSCLQFTRTVIQPTVIDRMRQARVNIKSITYLAEYLPSASRTSVWHLQQQNSQ